ncbi:MAG: hypothetical protein C5B51_22670 [Terriglobia bacterium]|nr:MAG: hypothetical protein C5B51_22670 [Terriglobia bacterium]
MLAIWRRAVRLKTERTPAEIRSYAIPGVHTLTGSKPQLQLAFVALQRASVTADDILLFLHEIQFYHRPEKAFRIVVNVPKLCAKYQFLN